MPMPRILSPVTIDLTNRAIVITGASSGIGAATALACARAGMDVVLSARRADRLEQVADEVRRLGREAHVVPGDAADPETHAGLLAVTPDFYGVFANAGYGTNESCLDASAESDRRIARQNMLVGLAIDEYGDERGTGDFLVRKPRLEER